MTSYRITIRGQVDVSELNTTSPHQMTPIPAVTGTTLVTICTDQAGLIGLIRHMHNLGFEIVSIIRSSEGKTS